MLKNPQVGTGEDRRSPPLFSSKKVCMDVLSSVCNGAAAATYPSEHNLQDKAVRKKKSVTFNDDKLEQRFEFDDDDQSKMSRMMYWEFMAVDRARFRDRIERLKGVLSPILTTAHRNVIYAHRIETSTEVTSPCVVDDVAAVVVVNKIGAN